MSNSDPETFLELSYRQSVTIQLALIAWMNVIDAGYSPGETEITKPEIEELLCELAGIEDAAYCIEFLEPSDSLAERRYGHNPARAALDEQKAKNAEIAETLHKLIGADASPSPALPSQGQTQSSAPPLAEKDQQSQ